MARKTKVEEFVKKTGDEPVTKAAAKVPKYPKIIAFCGPKGSGKDAAAGILKNHKHAKFAGGLKVMIGALLEYAGCDKKDVQYWVEGAGKEKPCPFLGDITPRYAMQTLGTEWGRDKMHKDFWVRMTENYIKTLGNYPVVITDLRFPNERDMVQKLGGVAVRIRPSNYDPKDAHQSEQHVMSMSTDIEVFNPFDGVDAFHETLRIVLDGYQK